MVVDACRLLLSAEAMSAVRGERSAAAAVRAESCAAAAAVLASARCSNNSFTVGVACGTAAVDPVDPPPPPPLAAVAAVAVVSAPTLSLCSPRTLTPPPLRGIRDMRDMRDMLLRRDMLLLRSRRRSLLLLWRATSIGMR